jgi:hypothetical protein
MKLIKAPVIYPSDPLLETFEQYFFCGGFPTISEADDEEFIKNFLDIFKEDTGIEVDRSTTWYRSYQEQSYEEEEDYES